MKVLEFHKWWIRIGRNMWNEKIHWSNQVMFIGAPKLPQRILWVALRGSYFFSFLTPVENQFYDLVMDEFVLITLKLCNAVPGFFSWSLWLEKNCKLLEGMKSAVYSFCACCAWEQFNFVSVSWLLLISLYSLLFPRVFCFPVWTHRGFYYLLSVAKSPWWI